MICPQWNMHRYMYLNLLLCPNSATAIVKLKTLFSIMGSHTTMFLPKELTLLQQMKDNYCYSCDLTVLLYDLKAYY